MAWKFTKSLGAITLVSALVAGCGGGDTQLRLSVRGGAPRTGAQAVQVSALAAEGLTVTRVRLLVRELEFETDDDASDDSDAGVDDDSSGTSSSSSSGDDDDDSREIERGPFVVDLDAATLSGGVAQVLSVDVPAGTYDEIEFKIDRATSSEDRATTDAAVKAMQAKNASVIVEGTIDGVPFEWVSGLEVEQEFEGRFELVDGANNVTLNVDTSRWFTDGSGNRLDPRSEASRSQIEGNVRASMRVLDDDDCDGIDDSGEDDHGGSRDD